MGLAYQRFHEKFSEILDVRQELVRVEEGFTFIEGPIWNPKTQALTFNDIPESKTYRYRPGEGVFLLRENTYMANGNAYDIQENIIVCEHRRSCISRTDDRGKGLEVLVSHYQGKELNSPNDVVVKSDGTIYFTDPTFGRTSPKAGWLRELEQDVRGVYAYHPDTGELRLLAEDFENPNGLCFSDDERFLFVNDSPRKQIRRFPVKEDGSLGEGILFAETKGDGAGLPDGMKLDSEGNLYCCAQGGIHIFDPKGVCLGIVEIPEQAGNCAFGGKEMDTLFVTASTALYCFQIRGFAWKKGRKEQ